MESRIRILTQLLEERESSNENLWGEEGAPDTDRRE